MKVLFAIVDGGGNIPPQLAVARAFRRAASRSRCSVIKVFATASKPPALRSNLSPSEGNSIPPSHGRWPPSWRRSPESRRIDASVNV